MKTKKFQTTTKAVHQPPTYEDRMPLHSWVAGAGLPLVQSIITAVGAMLMTAAVIFLFDGYDYTKPMIAIGTFTFIGYWVLMQRRWVSLTTLERWTGVDLDDDGWVGEPEPFKVQLQDVTPHKSFRQENYDWTKIITREQLIDFSWQVTFKNPKKPISRRSWTPKKNGFSDDQYRKWQEMMIAAELIEAKGDHFEATLRGLKFFTWWGSQDPRYQPKEDSPTPPPDTEDPG